MSDELIPDTENFVSGLCAHPEHAAPTMIVITIIRASQPVWGGAK